MSSGYMSCDCPDCFQIAIGDEGEVWYKLSDCPELNTEELRENFRRGVRSIRSEIRLSNDTEWDSDSD